MYQLEISLGSAMLTGLSSDAEGASVVFCHGNSGSAQLFSPLLQSELGRRRRLVALDLPGHGRSAGTSSPSTYSLVALADWLVRAIQSLGLERYALVGHSLGGHVISSALPRLHGATRLLLISAPPLRPDALGEAFAPDPSDGALYQEILAAAEVKRFARALTEPGAVPPSVLETLERAIAATDPRFRPALLQSILAGEVHDEAAALARAGIPTALVYGGGDRFLCREYCARTALPSPWRQGTILFPHSGHSPHLDAPDEFATLLASFVGEGGAA